jgi:hypothetical protein
MSFDGAGAADCEDEDTFGVRSITGMPGVYEGGDDASIR